MAMAESGARVIGIDIEPTRCARAQRGQLVHRRRRRRDALEGAVGRSRPFRATTDFGAIADCRRDHHLRADAAPQDEGSRHLAHRRGGPTRSSRTSARASSSSWSRRPTPARHSRSCRRCSRGAGSSPAGTSALAFSPERVDPGQPRVPDPEHPEGRRRRDAPPARKAATRALRARRASTVVPVGSPTHAPRW